MQFFTFIPLEWELLLNYVIIYYKAHWHASSLSSPAPNEGALSIESAEHCDPTLSELCAACRHTGGHVVPENAPRSWFRKWEGAGGPPNHTQLVCS